MHLDTADVGAILVVFEPVEAKSKSLHHLWHFNTILRLINIRPLRRTSTLFLKLDCRFIQYKLRTELESKLQQKFLVL